jgi:hypothetical protein
MKSMKDVRPVQMTLNSRFKFKCHPGVPCFTQCCGRIEIYLTPYDIVRMKNRLGISSTEFLERYTRREIDEKSGLPIIIMKLFGAKDPLCPFVTPDGCTIYSDRPCACRYYPIGQGTLQKEEDIEEFYFMIKEPYCKGFEEDAEWTVETWRQDQEPDVYDDMNREWKSMMLRRDSNARSAIDEKKQKMFYMAAYDLDAFRRFVLESRFLEVFDVEPETLAQIKEDEVALMKFGFRYLKYLLFIEESLKAKPDMAPAPSPAAPQA